MLSAVIALRHPLAAPISHPLAARMSHNVQGVHDNCGAAPARRSGCPERQGGAAAAA
jgi:hypothetical protein